MHLTPCCIGGSQALLCCPSRKSQSAFERRAGPHLFCALAARWLAAGMYACSGHGRNGVHCVTRSKAEYVCSCECLHSRTTAHTAPSACISGAALMLRNSPFFGCRRQLERQNAEEERASRKVLERLLAERRRHEEVNFEIRLRDQEVKVSWNLNGCAAGCRDAGAISLGGKLLSCSSLTAGQGTCPSLAWVRI